MTGSYLQIYFVVVREGSVVQDDRRVHSMTWYTILYNKSESHRSTIMSVHMVLLSLLSSAIPLHDSVHIYKPSI